MKEPSPAAVASPPFRSGAAESASENTGSRPGSRVWWWLVAACVIQVAVWTAWFILAAHHPVEEVPLATAGEGR